MSGYRGAGMGELWLKWAAAVACAMGLAACSTEGILPSSFLTPSATSNHVDNQPTKDSEKIIKLPARPEDLDCPDVDVTDGGATARVGGAAASEVRYQFDISDVSRECDPQGQQFALKIGVAGRLLIGPAGSPGAYSTTLHVEVKRDIDNKPVFQKSYSVAVNTAGADRAPFRIVTEPIMLPLTRARLDSDYSISVGLGGGGGTVTRHRRARRRE